MDGGCRSALHFLLPAQATASVMSLSRRLSACNFRRVLLADPGREGDKTRQLPRTSTSKCEESPGASTICLNKVGWFFGVFRAGIHPCEGPWCSPASGIETRSNEKITAAICGILPICPQDDKLPSNHRQANGFFECARPDLFRGCFFQDQLIPKKLGCAKLGHCFLV